MTFAPSYVASIVTVLVGLQALLGLDFTSEQWTSTITVLLGLFVMLRQVITGKSNLFGVRP